eukprot:3933153-Rhodomonas_salina.1
MTRACRESRCVSASLLYRSTVAQLPHSESHPATSHPPALQAAVLDRRLLANPPHLDSINRTKQLSLFLPLSIQLGITLCVRLQCTAHSLFELCDREYADSSHGAAPNQSAPQNPPHLGPPPGISTKNDDSLQCIVAHCGV